MTHSACVIHMSHYHVNEASRKSEKKGKLLVKASLSVFFVDLLDRIHLEVD